MKRMFLLRFHLEIILAQEVHALVFLNGNFFFNMAIEKKSVEILFEHLSTLFKRIEIMHF